MLFLSFVITEIENKTSHAKTVLALAGFCSGLRGNAHGGHWAQTLSWSTGSADARDAAGLLRREVGREAALGVLALHLHFDPGQTPAWSRDFGQAPFIRPQLLPVWKWVNIPLPES